MTARKPNLFLTIVRDNWGEFKQRYPAYATEYYDSVIEKVLGCGDPEFGYIDYQCMDCGQGTKRVAFSCRSRFCLRCSRMFAAEFIAEVQAKLHTGVVYRHLIFTTPSQLWLPFYQCRQGKELSNLFFRTGWECVQDVFQTATRKDLRCGCLMVLHVVGRKGDYKMHLHVLAMDGGIDRETGEWVSLPDFRYELLHKKWQYHLLKMVKGFFKTPEMLKLVDQLWKRYPNGFVAQILRGQVPKKMEKLTQYLSKYLFRPAIANKRIKNYDPDAGVVVYTYESHETKRTEVERVDVFKFLGRMLQQILPKGFQRVRYYGLQATASYAKSKERIQEAMGSDDGDCERGPDRFVAEGKVAVSAKKSGFDKKVFELTGEHPLSCPHCSKRMEVVKVWSKKHGVLVDRLATLRRMAKAVPRPPPLIVTLTRAVVPVVSCLDQQGVLAWS